MSDEILQTIQRELGKIVTTMEHLGDRLGSLDEKLQSNYMSKEAARRLEDKIESNKAEIEVFKASQVWLIRMFIGAVVSIVGSIATAAIVYLAQN